MAEVKVASSWQATTTEQVRIGVEQRPVLTILAEVVLSARNVIADLPDTPPTRIPCAVERVEGNGHAIICLRQQGTAYSGINIALSCGFNCGCVCLESHPAIVDGICWTGERAAELHGCWMQPGVPVGPDRH